MQGQTPEQTVGVGGIVFFLPADYDISRPTTPSEHLRDLREGYEGNEGEEEEESRCHDPPVAYLGQLVLHNSNRHTS